MLIMKIFINIFEVHNKMKKYRNYLNIKGGRY